jgi:hypothetical protein
MCGAQDDYLLNFNIDNMLYPTCLERLDERFGEPEQDYDAAIFSIVNHKRGIDVVRTGRPPGVGAIDCLQLIASRKAWESIGNWHRSDCAADGHLYADLATRFSQMYLDELLRENFQFGSRGTVT